MLENSGQKKNQKQTQKTIYNPEKVNTQNYPGLIAT